MRQTIAGFVATSMLVAIVAANCWAAPDDSRSERIQKNIKQVTEEGKPFDVEGLINDIQNLPNDLDEKTRSVLTSNLTRFLLYDGKMKYVPQPLTGRDPQDILRSTIIRALGRIGSKNDVADLQKFYVLHGDKGYHDLPAVIVKLGGTVPAKAQAVRSSIQQETALPISPEERQSRRAEVQSLLEQVQSGKVSNDQLAKTVSRIGEIGESQDAVPIIKKLAETNVHWIVRQDAYQVLGHLGGAEAIAYLLKELHRPMPNGAKLDDYADTQAILRSQAALALGQCGNTDTVAILEQVASDEKQFKRVRESCNKAISRIRDRSPSPTK